MRCEDDTLNYGVVDRQRACAVSTVHMCGV